MFRRVLAGAFHLLYLSRNQHRCKFILVIRHSPLLKLRPSRQQHITAATIPRIITKTLTPASQPRSLSHLPAMSATPRAVRYRTVFFQATHPVAVQRTDILRLNIYTQTPKTRTASLQGRTRAQRRALSVTAHTKTLPKAHDLQWVQKQAILLPSANVVSIPIGDHHRAMVQVLVL